VDKESPSYFLSAETLWRFSAFIYAWFSMKSIQAIIVAGTLFAGGFGHVPTAMVQSPGAAIAVGTVRRLFVLSISCNKTLRFLKQSVNAELTLC